MGIEQYAIAEELYSDDIKNIRKRLKLTQAEFARLVNISNKTVERWEGSDKPITGPIVPLVKILKEYPQIPDDLKVPAKEYPLRLWYMHRQEVCTVIDVDERERRVRIHNYTNDIAFQAFGRIKEPDFVQYEEFLESRCFPRSRDKMKFVLREMDLPFYDALMIVEKTQGRMAEDNFWIKIER